MSGLLSKLKAESLLSPHTNLCPRFVGGVGMGHERNFHTTKMTVQTYSVIEIFPSKCLLGFA